ncbi:MAG: YoaK family protein [Polyangiaceae bacterium]
MLSLHTQDSVFSLRHAPSWLSLAASAGAVNAVGFIACSRFVTHVTGTVSRIGIDAGAATTGAMALESAAVLGCLVLGAVTSAVLIDGRYHNGKRPLYAAPLFVVAALLTLLGVLGSGGAFGAFGADIDGPRGVAFLSLLAFAMGLQNAAVATSTGMIVRTTHLTGSTTDLGVHLATALHTRGDVRRTALRHAALRVGKITAFTAGAASGAVLAGALGFAALFFPAAIVAGATVLSFARTSVVAGEVAARA